MKKYDTIIKNLTYPENIPVYTNILWIHKINYGSTTIIEPSGFSSSILIP